MTEEFIREYTLYHQAIKGWPENVICDNTNIGMKINEDIYALVQHSAKLHSQINFLIVIHADAVLKLQNHANNLKFIGNASNELRPYFKI